MKTIVLSLREHMPLVHSQVLLILSIFVFAQKNTNPFKFSYLILGNFRTTLANTIHLNPHEPSSRSPQLTLQS